MQCYRCGAELTASDYCPSCGTNVRIQKRLQSLSARCYNEGLEKARVRNMTGAVESLRQSLKLDKNNIDARNLLGLVYYETGEVVAALTEWVISKNLQPEDNDADRYVEQVRSDVARFETENQTLKKFNVALRYCRQNALDLAVIQLKKVLQMNPGYVRAHLLLSLLYLNDKKPVKARTEANRALALDTGSILGARYLKEAEELLMPGEAEASESKRKEAIRYQSGNEDIIQPTIPMGLRRGGVFAGLLAGALLGIAIALYLILPARIQSMNTTNQQEIAAISEENDAKNARLLESEQREATLALEIDDLKAEIDELIQAGNRSTTADLLMSAVTAYLNVPEEDTAETQAQRMDQVEAIMNTYDPAATEETPSPQEQSLYNAFIAVVGEELTKRSYDAGYAAYRRKDYETAIPALARAFRYDGERDDALFCLGSAYYESGDTDAAKDTYNRVIQLFPNTKSAESAEAKLAEINNAS
ncbi:MAG: tetratricopeptide repeat protein [Butyrivibrio sp.]|nr:tetratricopeptide repeat protein [Butyrivibrio sp.]